MAEPGATADTKDAELKKKFAEQYKALVGRPFLLETNCETAWTLIAQVQLALRHPDNKGPSAFHARNVIQQMIETLCPEGTALREVAERGWNPAYDKDWR